MRHILEFLRSVSVHFRAKKKEEKSPRFVPFEANLTEYLTNLAPLLLDPSDVPRDMLSTLASKGLEGVIYSRIPKHPCQTVPKPDQNTKQIAQFNQNKLEVHIMQ